MGLGFLQPLYLLGALAAAVPVLIHLINRQRALVHRFPAVRFLLLADRRTARKFRVRQWLLLALRMLIICLFALILAQPRLANDAAAALSSPPLAMVILIDNSLSMQYRDGQETRWQRATVLARRFLRLLGPQDSAVVVPVLEATPTPAPVRMLSQERVAWEEQLQALQPHHATVDLAAAFQSAFTLLQASPAPRRQLVFLSDFTAQDWEHFHLSQVPIIPERLEVHCVRLGPPTRDDNVAITDVRITDKPFIANTPLEVTVFIRSFSAQARHNLRVDLLLGTETVGQQLADLGPDEQVTVPFRIPAPPAGLHWGEVRLQGDNFTDDDHFYYALRTAPPARVLVVDGDPGTSLFESDIFYLLRALQPHGALAYPSFYPKPITWEGLELERLSDYQMVILCNVEALTPQVRQRLYQFVAAGGGLVFFAGNRVDAARYNAMFYHTDTPLLPLPLAAPVQRPEEQPMALGTVVSSHEALNIFAGAEGLLQGAKFYRYVAVEGAAVVPGVRVLLSLQDAHPLLVEKDLGQGRVLFFTSSADRDWTDLPTQPAYVPLLYGLTGYAAHLSAATQRLQVFLPAAARLAGRLEDTDAPVTVQAPDGLESVVRYVRDGEATAATVVDYTLPGLYHLTTPVGADFLAVNATRAESDFVKLALSDLQADLQPLSVVLEEEAAFGRSAAAAALPVRELAGVLLLGLMAVLIAENVCANRF